MAGRGPQTFQKRQREQQRKEKQLDKLARRQQRKQEKGESAGRGPEIADFEKPIESFEGEFDLTARKLTASS